MTRRRVVAIALIVVAIGIASWPLNVLEVRARSPFATVASAFDPPPGYPGYRWSRDDRVSGEFELTTIAGPEHCHWQSATMLFIGWPPGTMSTAVQQAHLYIRDPQGAFGTEYRDRLVFQAALPADAKRTGYRLGPLELYLSPSDQDEAIYVVGPGGSERWPRSDPARGCA